MSEMLLFLCYIVWVD